MSNGYLEIRSMAKELLSQMTIIDGDAFISNILFKLSETDDTNLEIKKQTLSDIKELLNLKNKIKTKESDLYYLRNLSEQLNLESEKEMNSICLIKVIVPLNEEKYFITLKSANEYISSLNNKDNVKRIKIQNKDLSRLFDIIKRDF